jgi:hypothetical protein
MVLDFCEEPLVLVLTNKLIRTVSLLQKINSEFSSSKASWFQY